MVKILTICNVYLFFFFFFLVIQIFIKAQNTGHSLNTKEPHKGHTTRVLDTPNIMGDQSTHYNQYTTLYGAEMEPQATSMFQSSIASETRHKAII
jgi:hypothetical protein